MKKKLKYYSVYTILSIVCIICDSMVVYACYQSIIEHPDSLIMNIFTCSYVSIIAILLNIALFLQAKDLLKPRNECFIVKLPEVVENDNFEFTKLDL